MSSDLLKVKIFTNCFKRQRKFRHRPLAYSTKLILRLRLLLYALYSVFLIKPSGDVEINPGPQSNTRQSSLRKKTVKCASINVKSLTSTVKSAKGEISSNRQRFQNFVYAEHIDIVFANETWLSNSADNVELLHSKYGIFRNDREGRSGGVMLGIRTGIFKSVREIEHSYVLEVILVHLTMVSNGKYLFVPAIARQTRKKTWIETFESFLNDVCLRNSKIVLTGDFNLPRACWNSHENSTGASERTFITKLDDYFLDQMNNYATWGDNILDLVITSIPNKVNVCEILKPSDSEISTDHNAIIFDLKTESTVFHYQELQGLFLITVGLILKDYMHAYKLSKWSKKSPMTAILTTIGQNGKMHFLRR